MPLNDADRLATLVRIIARLIGTIISVEIDATVVFLNGIVIVALGIPLKSGVSL